MTTVSAGATGTYTLTGAQTIAIDVAAGEQAQAIVTRAGVQIYGDTVRSGTVIGPFLTGDVFTLTAQRGDVDYTVSSYTGSHIDTIDAAESTALQALVSADGNEPRMHELTYRLYGAFGTETFTRSGANASVIDCYGSMQLALAGEARFYGARRVCNLIADSEGLSTGWALGNTPTSTKTAYGRGQNHPRASAWQIDRPLGTSNMLVLSSASYRPGKYVLSAWLKGDGVTQVTLRIERSGDSAGTSQVVTPAAGVWSRYAVVHDILDTSNYRCWFSVTANQVASFQIADPQLEWAHNQASPAPADYVPRGVSTSVLPASVYAREAGVDGVRYYDTANPWALSSGVATRSQVDTPLDPATLRGLMVEPAATNQIYSSGALSAAEWSKTGGTTVNTTAIDSTVLGKSSLWKIQEAAATEGHRISQSWRGTVPAVNTILSASVCAKAAERSIAYIGIRALDGSTIRYCYFNLATGVVSNAASGGQGWMMRAGDVWQLGWSITAGATGSTAPLMNVGCCQVAGTENDAGTLNSGMYFGAPQFEAAATPSSYVGDTGSAATLTRNVELASIVSTSMPAIGWTVAMDYTPMFPTNTALKDTWWYILSTYSSAADRGAIGLRPAALGGFYDGGQGQVFLDFYPGISADNLNWDGVEALTGYAGVPGETTSVQWSAALAAQTGASNQAGCIGATVATLTGDSPRPAVNAWATVPRTWTLGRQHSGSGQRGPACWKNLQWAAVARTASEMQQAAA